MDKLINTNNDVICVADRIERISTNIFNSKEQCDYYEVHSSSGNGVISSYGKIIVPFKYLDIVYYDDNFTAEDFSGHCDVYDKDGNVIEKYDNTEFGKPATLSL